MVFKDPLSGYSHGNVAMQHHRLGMSLDFPRHAPGCSSFSVLYDRPSVAGQPSLPAIAPRPSAQYGYGGTVNGPNSTTNARFTAASGSFPEALAGATNVTADAIQYAANLVPAPFGHVHGGLIDPYVQQQQQQQQQQQLPQLPSPSDSTTSQLVGGLSPSHLRQVGFGTPESLPQATFLRVGSGPGRPGAGYGNEMSQAATHPTRHRQASRRLALPQGASRHSVGPSMPSGFVWSSQRPHAGAFEPSAAAAARYGQAVGMFAPQDLMYTSHGGSVAPAPHVTTVAAPAPGPLLPSLPVVSPLGDRVANAPTPKDDDERNTSSGIVADLIEDGTGHHHHPPEFASVMALQAGGEEQRPVRTLADFAQEPNMLATYRPSPLASQLMDPVTARIFGHFVTSTGPNFSIFERLPANPSALFTIDPTPGVQQGLWTYKLPVLALSSPPLLHAILALGTLHIAKLQGTSKVQSLKHYHFALRRVAKQVSTPGMRGEVTALAATLLLGFWEVVAAEHAKWNSHLSGARQLLDEYDFLGVTRRIRSLRGQSAIGQSRWPRSDPASGATAHPPGGEMPSLGSDTDINENLVSIFLGRQLRYDEYGQMPDETMMDMSAAAPTDQLTRKEIEDYEMRQDLFWWFAKQDAYQSILSGNSLL